MFCFLAFIPISFSTHTHTNDATFTSLILHDVAVNILFYSLCFSSLAGRGEHGLFQTIFINRSEVLVKIFMELLILLFFAFKVGSENGPWYKVGAGTGLMNSKFKLRVKIIIFMAIKGQLHTTLTIGGC